MMQCFIRAFKYKKQLALYSIKSLINYIETLGLSKIQQHVFLWDLGLISIRLED